MRVEQVMSRSVVTCTVDETLNAAAQLMWDRTVGSVVVLDQGGHPAGMITDRDVAMAAQTQGRPLREIPVRLAMAAEVESCRANETVPSVLARMQRRRVRRCPVVDDKGAVIGLLSLDELAKRAVTRYTGVGARALLATYAATASATGAQQAEAAPAEDGNGSRNVLLDPAALAGEVGDRARDAWGRLTTTLNELGEERPNRTRAVQLASTLIRNVQRRSRGIREKVESAQAPRGH